MCNCKARNEGINEAKIERKEEIELHVISDNEQDGPNQGEHETEETITGLNSCCCVSFSRANEEHINTQAFCFLLFYGVFLIGIAVIIILIFVLVPLASEELVQYLFEIFQLMVVLVSAQIAYQLLFSESFTLESVLQKFKEVYAKKGHNANLVSIANRKHEDLADIAGEFGAELTDVIINE